MMQSSTGSTVVRKRRGRRRWWIGLAIVAAIVALVGAYALGRGTGSSSSDHPSSAARTTTTVAALTASEVYKVVAPSMVVILGDPDTKDKTIGSGTIVTAAGAVLTARHVVEDASAIELVFADGTRSAATVASSDEATDSALLVPATLPEIVVPAVLGGGGVDIGSMVVAVGHPFGLTNSVSEGIVSGLGRTVTAQDGQELAHLIQFDAAVNPGNSGGPLLNDRGQVVGVVTALANPSHDAEFIGIGFAVPILTAVGGAGGDGAPPPQ
jgi:putative serine protease PepD